MLDRLSKILPTRAPTHTSSGFMLSGMKVICKQSLCQAERTQNSGKCPFQDTLKSNH